MELSSLIAGLSNPQAYPFATTTVEVRQTHISVVFLAGGIAYKIKKPRDFGFLDFTTLGKRRHFCAQEVRLNSRLAPGVYLGVVPVTVGGAGLKIDSQSDAEAIEWAVKMRRLRDDATLEAYVARGDAKDELVSALARKIAAFHAHAERGPHISKHAVFESIARTVRENFRQATCHIGAALSQRVYERLITLTESALLHHETLIEERAKRDVPCDTHGDLRLEHVYLFPDQSPPGDILVVDCIEFNQEFRFADPVADIAFLAMDLKFCGRSDLAQAFTDAYFSARNDDEGRALLPLYTSYRAAVRGKVQGMKMAEAEVPDVEREAALASARAHWLVALEELEGANLRPCMVLIGGLPGTGKSTLAAGLSQTASFRVIRADAIRKELAGISGPAISAFEKGIYTPDWTQRTYLECLARAQQLLFEGRRVIVDASFRDDAQRRAFVELANQWRVPVTLLLCEADPNEVRHRLGLRQGGPSDADWITYQAAAASWQEPSHSIRKVTRPIRFASTPPQVLEQALTALCELGVYAPG